MNAVFLSAMFVVGVMGCGDKTPDEAGKADTGITLTEEKKIDPKEIGEREKKIATIETLFKTSLHKTGSGMKHWYDNGSKKLIGKEYEELSCKNCHVKGCDACHKGDKTFEVAVKKDTCLECHSRYKAAADWDKANGFVDPHAKMECSTCHPASDLQGDGKQWVSMRDHGFLKADCLSCHEEGTGGATKYDSASDSHSAHDNLTCSACHTSNTVVCLNCHFDTFLATGKKKGNAVKGKDWLLLVNYKDKVTAGTMMSIVSNGKKYASIAPYTTHSIQAGGRTCGDCHENEAVKALARDETVSLAEFKDGKMVMTQGVVPAVEGKISLPFLEKGEDGAWVEMKGGEAPLMTFGGHATPLDAAQIEKLNQKVD